ncbi:hypothetical protein ACPESL_07960 [Psychrobacter pocilloporae]|uniref:hypothetical protein n=1 Tax=Psychrobacter pocilloporae TaxID=1775882 RepID=UPI003C301F8E
MQAILVGLAAVIIYSIGIAMGLWIGRPKRYKDWDDMAKRINSRRSLNGKATNHEVRLDNQGQRPIPPKTPMPMSKKPKK